MESVGLLTQQYSDGILLLELRRQAKNMTTDSKIVRQKLDELRGKENPGSGFTAVIAALEWILKQAGNNITISQACDTLDTVALVAHRIRDEIRAVAKNRE